ncbi:hypothetical protein LDG_7168 [Legionella drancourtii LLAP12]|uniref:Uncharacterized protein n=1 Tax=Legionella drancourtii LLAP12 TaxID=658187 RepID=G9EPI3_9GAMM|nr:hypothetical protein LDG_7168 [Legionella drancourtii LLAP12]
MDGINHPALTQRLNKNVNGIINLLHNSLSIGIIARLPNNQPI